MKRKRNLSTLLCASMLFAFLIGTHEGRLSIWKDGDPAPAKVLPVPTALLPSKVQSILRQGVRVESDEEMAQLLEAFTS